MTYFGLIAWVPENICFKIIFWFAKTLNSMKISSLDFSTT